jgi:hypothetical protein
MHQEHGMPFKAFVSTFMDLLEDADGMVRDTARNSVIELFQYVWMQSMFVTRANVSQKRTECCQI